MTPISEASSIVLLGHWNRMIFSPAWVSEKLFKEQNLELGIPFAVTAPVIFKKGSIQLKVHELKVALVASSIDDEPVAKLVEINKRLLAELPVTPLTAVGMNFGFEEKHPDADLLNLFNANDLAILGGFGTEIPLRGVSRKVQLPSGQLNLALSLSGGQVAISCNFHHELASASAVSEVVTNSFKDNRNLALKILNEVYDLSVGD